MRNLIVACTALLVLCIAFAIPDSGPERATLANAFAALSPAQQTALSIAAAAAILLLAAALWQGHQLNRQRKELRAAHERLEGVRRSTLALASGQNASDVALAQLVGSEPEDTLTTLSQKLTEAEQRTLAQQSQNEAVDLESRAEEIRRRQQALRARIGDVIEKRRLVEPIFGELKERQAMISRTLAEYEATQGNKSLEQQLQELTAFVHQTEDRFDAFDRGLATLEGLKGELGALQARLAPLDGPAGGIRTVLREVGRLGDRLSADLDRMEMDGDRKLSDRVTELVDARRAFEERVARLTEHIGTLETIRADIGGLLARLSGVLEAYRVDGGSVRTGDFIKA